jgi:hypothetical protein
MKIDKCRSCNRSRLRSASRGSVILAACSLVGLQPQVVHAQAAPAQSVQHLIPLGQTIIRAIPEGSGTPATPEVRNEIDVGVKQQTPAASAVLAPVASGISAKAQNHFMPIPSKEDARIRVSALAAISAPAAPALPLPEPRARSSRVVDLPGAGVSGFPGLTHADQRLANHGNQFSLEPPDQALCVGNGFVVEAVNNAIRVYDTFGNALTPVEALNPFFGLADELVRSTGVTGPTISDPKCAYDADSQRWFVTELMIDSGTNVGATGRSFNLIAVSQSADPRGGFAVFTYDVTDDGLNGTPAHPNCPCFGDQPLLGFDHYGVYQSTNEFGDSTGFNGAQIYAISKRELIEAAGGESESSPKVVHLDAGAQLVPYGGLSYTIQPAVTSAPNQSSIAIDSAGGGVELFLSALQFGNPGYEVYDNRIAVWALRNTRSLNSEEPSLSLSFEVMNSETYGQPDPAAQRPGPTPLGTALGDALEFIATNDDRMNQVVYANGLLYSAVNSKLRVAGADQTGIAWFAVQPSLSGGAVHGHVVQQGYVAVAGNNVIYPSIARGAAGPGTMVFTLVGPGYFPSAAYTSLGQGEDGASTVHVAADGTAPDDGFTGYPQFFGSNVARWGDYSAAVTDGASIWLATEYIPGLPRTVNSNWGTYVFSIKP